MKKFLLSIMCIFGLLPANCQIAQRTSSATESSWSDSKAKFELLLSGGKDKQPFVATIRISNLTDKPLSFPTPLVMPLCGDTNKNNIRIFDKEGNKLRMTGIHADFFERPISVIAPKTSKAWTFELDQSFPDLKNAGIYEVKLWYFSDEYDKATWKGRVEMDSVSIRRE